MLTSILGCLLFMMVVDKLDIQALLQCWNMLVIKRLLTRGAMEARKHAPCRGAHAYHNAGLHQLWQAFLVLRRTLCEGCCSRKDLMWPKGCRNAKKVQRAFKLGNQREQSLGFAMLRAYLHKG